MAKTLDSFTLTPLGDDYLLTIEDEDGETIELQVDFDQLELIAEQLERCLDADSDAHLADDSEEGPDEAEES